MSHPLPPAPSGVDADVWASTIESIRAYCGWHIAPQVTETVTLDGPGGSLLFLPTLRLVDLTSVSSDGTAVSEPEWSESGMVRASSWSSKYRSVTVTMTHGYEEWPAELVTVAQELITASSREGASSVVSGAHQVRYEAPMSSRQRGVLDRYRLVNLP